MRAIPKQAAAAARTRGERGFTLVELLVSLAAMTIIILAALMVFDFNSRLARVQTQVSDMQQALRTSSYEVVRVLRMAGRGGLPVIGPNLTYPRGIGLEVRNNVGTGATPPAREIAIGGVGSPQAVQGTDILTVRGVFSTPIYQINSANAATYALLNGAAATTNPAQATGGVVQICTVTPAGVNQDVQPLRTAIANGTGEGLVLVSPLGEQYYGVVELNPTSSVAGSATQCPGGGVTVGFRVSGSTLSNAYRTLGPISTATAGLDPRLTAVAFVGVIEEYRYYIREEYSIAGNNATEISPRLSMARMFPGTETAYQNLPDNLRLDITDGNIADLQVALGLDTDGDGNVTSGTTAATLATDEWLFNGSGDDATQAKWRTIPGSAPARSTPIYYARLSILARTGRRDPNFQAQPLVGIEDRSYSSAGEPANKREQRMFRRRVLQTVVDLRNLS
jgi:prepilin-type N-terminal cleavage/methylation domain-containing protein